MYSNFKEQAIEYVRQAVAEDNAGNYAKAFPLYMNALEYFKTHLKHEKNPKIKEAITQKSTEYLRRAEEIRAVLDNQLPPPPQNPNFSSPLNSKEEAFACVRQAVASDDAGDYRKAFSLYTNALEYFQAWLKHEREPRVKEAIAKKFDEYMRRAQEIRAVLDLAGPREKTGGLAPALAPEKKEVDFKEQAIEYLRRAVAADNASDYAKAFPLYMNALEYFKAHLKFETDYKIMEAITHKFNEYLRRAEEIRALLDEAGSTRPDGADEEE